MAIKIPQNMIFGTPNIELITENKINKIDYTNNIIKGKYSQILKSVYSKTITAWSLQENATKYTFNVEDNGEEVILREVNYANTGIIRYFAEIDLKQIKSEFFFSSHLPYDKAYFKFTINSYMNDQTSEMSSEANTTEENLLWYSSSTNSPLKVYTKQEKPTDEELYSKGWYFNPIWQFNLYDDTNNVYYDYINSKMYFYLGRREPSNKFIAITTFLTFELFYPSFELETNKKEITSLENNDYTTSNYTMENNSFINSYIDDTNNEINFIDNQAREIMFNYENGRLRANITCNYGQYMNDDGTIAYSGKDGKTIKTGDIVQLNLNKINKHFEVLKSEIVYSGNIRVNLSLEEISKVFGISQKIGDGLSITYNRTYSEIGSIGNITSNDKLYENDIIKINVTINNSSAYSLNSIIVNGENFINGNSITITKDLNVYATSNIKIFKIDSTLGEGIKNLYINRESSPIGKGNLGIIDVNSNFYYGDVITITWDLVGNHEVKNAYFNDQRLFRASSNRATITKDSILTIPTIKLGWTTLWEGNVEYNMLERNGTESEITLNLEELLGQDVSLQERPTLFHFERVTCRYGDLSLPYYNLNGFDGYSRTYYFGERLYGGDLDGSTGSFNQEPYMIINSSGSYPTRFIRIERNVGSYKNYNVYEECIFSEFVLVKIEQYISS